MSSNVEGRTAQINLALHAYNESPLLKKKNMNFLNVLHEKKDMNIFKKDEKTKQEELDTTINLIHKKCK